jgi:ketosteroid isomerase-like protein
MIVVVGCVPQQQALSENDLAGIQTLLETVQRTVSAEDNAAWANTFTTDGRFLYANMPPLRGRPAIQQWGESGPRVTSLVFSDVEIEGAGDTAWATGVQTLMVDGSPAPDRGKWLMVMQRQADGSWLTAAASVSSDSPPPAGTP